jgi:hypothetical protein
MSSRKVREMLRLRRLEFDDAVEAARKDNEFDAMTKAELIAYAEENGIKVDKAAKKAEIKEAIIKE